MKVDLSGFKELDQALAEITKSSTARGVLQRSLKSAAMPMAEVARELAPDDPETGGYDLKRSTGYGTKLSRKEAKRHRKATRNSKAFVEGFVGAGPLVQGPKQEFGTVNHAPQPFLRPAFDREAMPTIDRLGDALATEIDKTARRVAAKARKTAR